MMRKPIFDTIRVQLGRGFTQAEVDQIDLLLDGLGLDRDPALSPTPVAGGQLTVGDAVGLDDPAAFFDAVRADVFGGTLKPDQVGGLTALLNTSSDVNLPLAFTAYLLATAAWETAYTVQPVREAFWLSEDWRRRNLTRYYPFYGRGYVQLTWRTNYERADSELGLGGRLTADLDAAMDPDIAAQIIAKGMIAGWFCGDKSGRRHTLERHLPTTGPAGKDGFKSARRIINGTDKAATIADEALKFQDALAIGGWQ